MKKVSIIIPVYNAEKYLERCINSVCKQTLESVEVIAVNDGSTDGSLQILEKLEEKYECLKVINKINGGASSARNAGIDCAAGEYIGFADSDDFAEPDMYEVLYNNAVKEDADIVFCNLYKNDDVKMPPYLENGMYSGENLKKYIYPRLISSEDESRGMNTLRGAVYCKLFKRDLIEDNHIRFREDLIYNEDGLFSIEATLKCRKYLYIGDRYLYHYCVNGESITKRYIPDLWDIQKHMTEYLEDAVSGTEYDFGFQIDKKLFEIAVYCFENEMKKNNGKGFFSKRSCISDIISDSRLKSAAGGLDKSRLKKINKAYLFSIKHRLPLLAMMSAVYRYR